MDKYIFYVVFMLSVVLFYFTLPKEYKKQKKSRILIFAFIFISFTSSVFMITFSRMIDFPFVTETVSYITLISNFISLSGVSIFLIRYVISYVFIKTKNYYLVDLIVKPKIYVTAILILASCLLIFGTIHYNTIQINHYDVNLSDDGEDRPNQIKVCLISDVHLGAGANKKLVDQMKEKIQSQNPDLICIAGDMIDMTTAAQELNYFAKEIGAIEVPYGIFYAEGNHEKDSNLDITKVFDEAGIKCLYDEVYAINDSLSVIGREDVSDKELNEVENYRDDTKNVIIQHRPSGFERLKDTKNLVLCGHTHGYQMPHCVLTIPLVNEVPYGYYSFGNLKVITSSGVGAWGFRVKWPSYNEIVMINLVY